MTPQIPHLHFGYCEIHEVLERVVIRTEPWVRVFGCALEPTLCDSLLQFKRRVRLIALDPEVWQNRSDHWDGLLSGSLPVMLGAMPGAVVLRQVSRHLTAEQLDGKIVRLSPTSGDADRGADVPFGAAYVGADVSVGVDHACEIGQIDWGKLDHGSRWGRFGFRSAMPQTC
ncbi:hypothetical protein [Nocardia nova]|uniref:hypothetical protein n=1 Tax=Nocardia nova TaxID=37330 RepID=UPI0011DD2FD6|nr:hypothetical protein [Nocardia nova]